METNANIRAWSSGPINHGRLWVRETYINATDHVGYGDSEWYETFTRDIGKLYRSLRKEYGGQVVTMYRDTDGPPVKVGWVFTKRVRYEDTPETYLREVWVEVSTTPVERLTTYTPQVSPWGPSYDDPNRDRATHPMEGDRTACRVCTSDIEFHGKGSGWIDRGGNRYCDSSGMAPRDKEGERIPLPHKLHKPYSDRGNV